MTARPAFPSMVSLFIYGLSVYRKNFLTNTCYRFFAIVSLVRLPSSFNNPFVCFRLFVQRLFSKWLHKSKKKNTCEVCGTQNTRNNFVHHKKTCSAGSLTCRFSSNFLINFQTEMNYHSATKHSKATVRVVHECKICDNSFTAFTYCGNKSGWN